MLRPGDAVPRRELATIRPLAVSRRMDFVHLAASLEKNFSFFGPRAAPFSDDSIAEEQKTLARPDGRLREQRKSATVVNETDCEALVAAVGCRFPPCQGAEFGLRRTRGKFHRIAERLPGKGAHTPCAGSCCPETTSCSAGPPDVYTWHARRVPHNSGRNGSVG